MYIGEQTERKTQKQTEMTETVVDQINAALELARFAVDSDSQQDYGVAIRKYRETIRAMETVKDRISQDGARALLSEKVPAQPLY